MSKVNVYLTFNGNCEEAFNFYKSVFKGEFEFVGRFGDMPQQEGMPEIPESAKNLIMHVSLAIDKDTTIMGSDTNEMFAPNVQFGNNFSLSINTDSMDEANRLFAELSAGGNVTMPLNETFWGAYYGMFTDKFGINWMVNYELNQENK